MDVTTTDGPTQADTGGGDDATSAGDAADAAPETGPPRIPCTPPTTPDAGDAATGDGGGDASSGTDGAASDDAGDAGASEDGAAAADGAAAEGGRDAGDSGASAGTCPGALTCCGGWCVDLAKDPSNCGSCGNACTSAQFCTGTACDDAVLKNICANPTATVQDDRFPLDNTAGSAIASALASGCMPAVITSVADPDSGVAQDPGSGRPLTGPGDTFVVAGGWFGQPSVAYMDGQKLTPVLVTTNGTSQTITVRKSNMVLAKVDNTMLTAHHDYFVLELSVEPASGTLCFFGSGLQGPGTAAAGYYFQKSVIANAAMFPDAWYVYEWTDTDNDGAPSAGDTFAVLGHGT